MTGRSGTLGSPNVRTAERSVGGFTTIPVYETTSPLPQGETEIVADQAGHVVVAWMDGSPANQARMTIRSSYSEDGGRSFQGGDRVAKNLILADPTLTLAPGGPLFLGALRKDSRLQYKDLAVVLFASRNFGKTWDPPFDVNDDNVFDDRPWISSDATGLVHAVFTQRIVGEGGSFDGPIYYEAVRGEQALSPKVLVNPVRTRGQGVAGGSPRGVAVTSDGRIVAAYQNIPEGVGGRGTSESGGAVAVSRDRGLTFGPPIPFTTNGSVVPESIVQVEPGESATPAPRARGGGIRPFPRIATVGNDVWVVWIGEAGQGANAVYASVLRDGTDAFTPPVPVERAPARSLTLPTIAVDRASNVHVFWIGKGSDGLWTLFYAHSGDRGGSFGPPRRITDAAFPVTGWIGDFMGAAVNDRDVFVAWPANNGSKKAINVSVARGVIGGF